MKWRNPQLVVLVLHNNDLNQVTWEQRIINGDPKYSVSQDLPNFPYAPYAESLGLKGIRVDRAEDLARVWDEALTAERPCVIDAIADPNVPPLPPHITFEQARKFTDALLHRDPDELQIVRQSITQMLSGLLFNRHTNE